MWSILELRGNDLHRRYKVLTRRGGGGGGQGDGASKFEIEARQNFSTNDVTHQK